MLQQETKTRKWALYRLPVKSILNLKSHILDLLCKKKLSKSGQHKKSPNYTYCSSTEIQSRVVELSALALPFLPHKRQINVVVGAWILWSTSCDCNSVDFHLRRHESYISVQLATCVHLNTQEKPTNLQLSWLSDVTMVSGRCHSTVIQSENKGCSNRKRSKFKVTRLLFF